MYASSRSVMFLRSQITLSFDGQNTPQVEAMVDNVKDKLIAADIYPKRIEGMKNAGWILMDYGDVVVHVFSKQDRLFYDLERVWRDGKTVSVDEL